MPAVMRLGVVAVLVALSLASCLGSEDEKTAGARAEGCSQGAAKGPFAQLRYRVESTPGAPGSFAETMSALCRRLSRLGHTRFSVRQGGHELLVRVPRRLSDEVTTFARPGRVAFFDWEPNVLGPSGPDSPFRGRAGLYQAVETASGMAPSAEPTDASPAAPLTPEESDRRNNAFGELHYLFDPDRRLLAGPAAAPGSLATARARAPAGSRVLEVPQGIAVVAAQGHREGWFVIEDDSELSRPDIARPRAEVDARTEAPGVEFDFTETGRAAFAALTRRVAQRGVGPGAAPTVAIVLDGRVVSRVTVDSAANPGGLDGKSGARISDVDSRRLARRLALLLREDPLPANLVPLFGEG